MVVFNEGVIVQEQRFRAADLVLGNEPKKGYLAVLFRVEGYKIRRQKA